MIFTVVWDPDAENELAASWLQAPDKQAVSDSANRIDARLRVDPDQEGEPFHAGRRVLFEPPLGVVFEISEPDRMVRVLAAWYIPRYTTNGEPFTPAS